MHLGLLWFTVCSVLLYSPPAVPLLSNNIKMVFLRRCNRGNHKGTPCEFYCTSTEVFSLKRTLQTTKKCILTVLYIMMVCWWQTFIFVKNKPDNILKPCDQRFDHVVNVQWTSFQAQLHIHSFGPKFLNTIFRLELFV